MLFSTNTKCYYQQYIQVVIDIEEEEEDEE